MAKKNKSIPEFHHAAAARARREEGQDRRAIVPLESHATVPSGRDDAMDIITAQDVSRLTELVPIRHGRMSVSPFTFYRATAAVMASDLSRTPTTDLTLQICGDAHLSNFGVFSGPDRRLVFDLNDFDETLTGPFEWDVKRLAASITLAGRNNDFREKEIRKATRSAVTAYREALDRFSQIAPLALNYRRIEIEPVIQSLKDPTMRKRADKVSQKALLRDSIAAVGKLTEIVNGRHQIVSRPPLIIRLDEQLAATGSEEIQEFFRSYLSTLPHHRQHLLSHYAVVDVAHKIVGVGSVGTRCMIVLLESGDGHPLFLQFKEAGPSVLEPYCGASPYAEHGERVVQGQRLMQTTGDIFLGWSQLHRGAHDRLLLPPAVGRQGLLRSGSDASGGLRALFGRVRRCACTRSRPMRRRGDDLRVPRDRADVRRRRHRLRQRLCRHRRGRSRCARRGDRVGADRGDQRHLTSPSTSAHGAGPFRGRRGSPGASPRTPRA